MGLQQSMGAVTPQNGGEKDDDWTRWICYGMIPETLTHKIRHLRFSLEALTTHVLLDEHQ